ncbi:helix-turn-helix domain-containing protein [Vibrio sp. M260112]|uniref:helix-turn-helix domain-containing protein n=1 Tax=Vibrio sp. M260112 TaxID=3020895 RepID=UPI002F4031D8
MNNQWMSVKDICKLPGMPSSGPGVHKKAKREGWRSRKQEGVQGSGIEYLVTVSSSGEAVYVQREDREVIDSVKDQNPDRYNSHINAEEMFSEFALIPGYRIQVSAGHGSLNPDQLEPTRYLAFRRKWLKYRGFNEKDLAIVWAKGDSMEPTIHNNDTLVVHLGRNKPADGHIYIFRNGDELFVKRYQSMLGTWRLISDNSFYSPLDIPKEDQHQFEVVGQVVHIAKDIGD